MKETEEPLSASFFGGHLVGPQPAGLDFVSNEGSAEGILPIERVKSAGEAGGDEQAPSSVSSGAPSASSLDAAAPADALGRNALHLICCRSGGVDSEAVGEAAAVLGRRSGAASERDIHGRTALMHACMKSAVTGSVPAWLGRDVKGMREVLRRLQGADDAASGDDPATPASPPGRLIELLLGHMTVDDVEAVDQACMVRDDIPHHHPVWTAACMMTNDALALCPFMLHPQTATTYSVTGLGREPLAASLLLRWLSSRGCSLHRPQLVKHALLWGNVGLVRHLNDHAGLTPRMDSEEGRVLLQQAIDSRQVHIHIILRHH